MVSLVSHENQERAKAMFFDAGERDGNIYELGVDGKILCRYRLVEKKKPLNWRSLRGF